MKTQQEYLILLEQLEQSANYYQDKSKRYFERSSECMNKNDRECFRKFDREALAYRNIYLQLKREIHEIHIMLELVEAGVDNE